MKVKLVSTFMLLSLFWIFIFIYVLSISLPYNTTSRLFVGFNIPSIKQLFPEGFGFFTKNPRENQFAFYKVENNVFYELTNKDSKAIESFYFSRKGRAKNLEAATICESLIGNVRWKECSNLPREECFYSENIPSYEIKNSTQHALICGIYIVQIYEPLPWAWALEFSQERMPSKIVRLRIICE